VGQKRQYSFQSNRDLVGWEVFLCEEEKHAFKRYLEGVQERSPYRRPVGQASPKERAPSPMVLKLGKRVCGVKALRKGQGG